MLSAGEPGSILLTVKDAAFLHNISLPPISAISHSCQSRSISAATIKTNLLASHVAGSSPAETPMPTEADL